MQKFPRRWSKVTCINYLQRKIILNSIMYYEYDVSRLSDEFFDEISFQLVSLQKDFAKSGHSVEKETEYGYMMYDFDGSTGFDLYKRLNSHDTEYLTLLVLQGLPKDNKNNSVVENKSIKKKGRLF